MRKIASENRNCRRTQRIRLLQNKAISQRFCKIFQSVRPLFLDNVEIQLSVFKLLFHVAQFPEIRDVRYRVSRGSRFFNARYNRAIFLQSNVQRVQHETQLISHRMRILINFRCAAHRLKPCQFRYQVIDHLDAYR